MLRLAVPRTIGAPQLTRDDVLGSGIVHTNYDWTIGGHAYQGTALAPDHQNAPHGTIAFYNAGLAWLIDIKEGSGTAGRVARRAAIRGFGLLGALVAGAVTAAAHTPLLDKQLADQRTFLLSYVDIVEVVHDRVGPVDYLVITAQFADGGRYSFCFHPLGAGRAEMLFVLRFFAERQLLAAHAARSGQQIDPGTLLGQLAHFQHVPQLAPYFRGTPVPPALPPVKFLQLGQEEVPYCPTCGADARWIAEHNTWGCDRCQRTLDFPPRAAPPPAPFCPRCGAQARWIAEHNCWGCDRCQQVVQV